jgi:hypothetical protein
MTQTRAIARLVDGLRDIVVRVCSTRQWAELQEAVVKLRLQEQEVHGLVEILTGLRYFRAQRYGVTENDIQCGRALYARLSIAFGTVKFPPIDNESRTYAPARIRKVLTEWDRAAEGDDSPVSVITKVYGLKKKSKRNAVSQSEETPTYTITMVPS